MNFLEQNLDFSEEFDIEESPLVSSFDKQALDSLRQLHGDTEEAGITVRIGNSPIVRNLYELIKAANATVPPEIAVLFNKSDIYTIVHAIGAIRTKGRASVDELQYHAEVINPAIQVQTIDLLPSTRFKEVFNANISFSGSMLADGNFGSEVPEILSSNLLPSYLSFGGDMKVQLSSNASFIGKFTYSVKFPVIQSMGIASNKCSWVLNPDEDKTPLLGDQLLVQTIAVPKGNPSLRYKIHGVLKVNRGLWWRQQTKNTNVFTVDVKLS